MDIVTVVRARTDEAERRVRSGRRCTAWRRTGWTDYGLRKTAGVKRETRRDETGIGIGGNDAGDDDAARAGDL